MEVGIRERCNWEPSGAGIHAKNIRCSMLRNGLKYRYSIMTHSISQFYRSSFVLDVQNKMRRTGEILFRRLKEYSVL